MYSVTVGKDEKGSLVFHSSRGGKLVDVTTAPRAKMIDLNGLTKGATPVYKSLYVLHHKIVVPMARLEDGDIDAIYVNKQNKHAIFVAPKCKVTCKFSRSKEESVKNK